MDDWMMMMSSVVEVESERISAVVMVFFVVISVALQQ